MTDESRRVMVQGTPLSELPDEIRSSRCPECGEVPLGVIVEEDLQYECVCWRQHHWILSPVRFNYLTPWERHVLCNGCGPKFGGMLIPDWCFTASCDHHDFNYWLGVTEDDRKKADAQFYEAMVADANRHGKWPWTRWWYRRIAKRYYYAVRLLGGAFFNYQEDRRTWDVNQIREWICRTLGKRFNQDEK